MGQVVRAHDRGIGASSIALINNVTALEKTYIVSSGQMKHVCDLLEIWRLSSYAKDHLDFAHDP